MGDGLLIDIVLFAMVAGFLLLRLRSVLGRRTGTERERPNPFAEAARPPVTDTPANGAKILPLPARRSATATPDDGPAPVGVGVAAIQAADRSFNETEFVEGARSAFEWIVTAFADGAIDRLKPLLAGDVFQRFVMAVDQRRKAGQNLTFKLESIEAADLFEARLDGRTARITVRFVSRQINLLRDADGKVIDGNGETAEEVVDFWTFARDTQSSDPNWLLVATRTMA
jgi:predicted lipid-binding transport protein (Tim44 family)